jgi:hypothetical protein
MRWSQEALAAELSVSVSTISRWERAAAAEVRNPFANFIRATVTRSSHRLALYARAMLPRDYLKEVRHSNSERTVPPRCGTGANGKTSCRDWSSRAEFRCLQRDCFRHARRTAGYHVAVAEARPAFAVSSHNRDELDAHFERGFRSDLPEATDTYSLARPLSEFLRVIYS